jgi:hypothetical protein
MPKVTIRKRALEWWREEGETPDSTRLTESGPPKHNREAYMSGPMKGAQPGTDGKDLNNSVTKNYADKDGSSGGYKGKGKYAKSAEPLSASKTGDTALVQKKKEAARQAAAKLNEEDEESWEFDDTEDMDPDTMTTPEVEDGLDDMEGMEGEGMEGAGEVSPEDITVVIDGKEYNVVPAAPEGEEGMEGDMEEPMGDEMGMEEPIGEPGQEPLEGEGMEDTLGDEDEDQFPEKTSKKAELKNKIKEAIAKRKAIVEKECDPSHEETECDDEKLPGDKGKNEQFKSELKTENKTLGAMVRQQIMQEKEAQALIQEYKRIVAKMIEVGMDPDKPTKFTSFDNFGSQDHDKPWSISNNGEGKAASEGGTVISTPEYANGRGKFPDKTYANTKSKSPYEPHSQESAKKTGKKVESKKSVKEEGNSPTPDPFGLEDELLPDVRELGTLGIRTGENPDTITQTKTQTTEKTMTTNPALAERLQQVRARRAARKQAIEEGKDPLELNEKFDYKRLISGGYSSLKE